MRGTAFTYSVKVTFSRITPAHAGNSKIFCKGLYSLPDHPRACGEQSIDKGQTACLLGSPPRMRGTGQRAMYTDNTVGITPAHAGNSYQGQGCGKYTQDHPRACGEQRAASRLGNCWKGSPPRMRGTEHRHNRREPEPRITPAHAGNSHAPGRILPAHKDHPRACGEQSPSPGNQHCQQGSPPRMRGTANKRSVSNEKFGITPAHAGNSGRLCPSFSPP